MAETPADEAGPQDIRAQTALGRHPRDLARLVFSGAIVAVAFVIAGHHRVDPLEAALYRDAQSLPSWLAPVSRAISVAGSVAGIAIVAGLALLAKRMRAAVELVIAGTAGWVAGNLLSALASQRAVTIGTQTLPNGVHHNVVLHTTFPADHMAVAAVLATVASPYLPRAWGFVPALVVAAVAVAQDFTGRHLALDILAGAFIGFGVGSVFHLVWGAPGRAVSTRALARALRSAGFDPDGIGSISAGLFGPRRFEVRTGSGPHLIAQVVRRGQRRAGPTYRVRRMLAALDVEEEPRLSSPSHEVDHQAYVNLLAERAGVRTAPVLLATELGHGPAVLVCEKLEGRRLPDVPEDEVDDSLLDEIWAQVELLAQARIAHHELTAANVLVDDKQDPWLLDFSVARAGASTARLAQDVGEMLISLTSVVGVKRAVDSAERVVPRERLTAALTYLQPLALPASIRRQLDGRRWLLADLAGEVANWVGEARPSFRPKIRAATILTLVVGGGAVYLLLPQIGTVPQLLTSVRKANYLWMVVAFLAGTLTFPMAAASYIGSVPRRIPWGWTTLAQVASAFTSRLTPGGVGGMGLNL
ncbi:MAG TPA: hypothetical protein VGR90_00005, partial [Acidimicrobiales bacterium]|nr:hypothetical protein [Acidimicrobiales bacterium]